MARGSTMMTLPNSSRWKTTMGSKFMRSRRVARYRHLESLSYLTYLFNPLFLFSRVFIFVLLSYIHVQCTNLHVLHTIPGPFHEKKLFFLRKHLRYLVPFNSTFEGVDVVHLYYFSLLY